MRDAVARNLLIIEDDYNNEFRYFSKPRPCLQGLAGGGNVVYLSTFSKLLLPSIRLSFMILPDSLLPVYQAKKALYNQTASKAEQLALCQFLRDGHLDAQIRKLKRLYAGKARSLAAELEQVFGSRAQVSMGESVTLVHLKIKIPLTNQDLCERARKKGILVFASPKESKEYARIALSVCEVPSAEFPAAARLLYAAAFD